MTESTKENDRSLRGHLVWQLSGGNAHITFDEFIKNFPADNCGERLEGLPYTAWQVLEHLRIAQWDILEFCRHGDHVSPKWPEGYWPKREVLGDADLWKQTVERFRNDLKEMQELISDRSIDL